MKRANAAMHTEGKPWELESVQERPCPHCRGPVIRWPFGRVCASCHRRLEPFDVTGREQMGRA